MTKEPFDYTGFNETELMQVASVLAVTNPAHCGSTPEGLERTKRHIVGHARAEYERSGEFGYLGTLGYVVSTYRFRHGSSDVTTVRFKVTLESWGVLQYLNGSSGHHNEKVITSEVTP